VTTREQIRAIHTALYDRLPGGISETIIRDLALDIHQAISDACKDLNVQVGVDTLIGETK